MVLSGRSLKKVVNAVKEEPAYFDDKKIVPVANRPFLGTRLATNPSIYECVNFPFSCMCQNTICRYVGENLDQLMVLTHVGKWYCPHQ